MIGDWVKIGDGYVNLDRVDSVTFGDNGSAKAWCGKALVWAGSGTLTAELIAKLDERVRMGETMMAFPAYVGGQQ
tara:strand:- start:2377 stop:2601 length:225 start_codon:yes stop_codon:yes gene_type:complete